MVDPKGGRKIMKFENTEVWGFEHSLRGMRNGGIIRKIT